MGTLRNVFAGALRISRDLFKPSSSLMEDVESFKAVYADRFFGLGEQKLVRFEPVPNFFPPIVLTRRDIAVLNRGIGAEELEFDSAKFKKDEHIRLSDYLYISTSQDQANITKSIQYHWSPRDNEPLRAVHYRRVK